MRIKYALSVAGNRPLNSFVWGDELIAALNPYLPIDGSLDGSDTGSDALTRLDLLEEEARDHILDLNVRMSHHQPIYRCAASPSPSNGTSLLISLALCLVAAAVLMNTGLDTSEAGTDSALDKLAYLMAKIINQLIDIPSGT